MGFGEWSAQFYNHILQSYKQCCLRSAEVVPAHVHSNAALTVPGVALEFVMQVIFGGPDLSAFPKSAM